MYTKSDWLDSFILNLIGDYIVLSNNMSPHPCLAESGMRLVVFVVDVDNSLTLLK